MEAACPRNGEGFVALRDKYGVQQVWVTRREPDQGSLKPERLTISSVPQMEEALRGGPGTEISVSAFLETPHGPRELRWDRGTVTTWRAPFFGVTSEAEGVEEFVSSVTRLLSDLRAESRTWRMSIEDAPKRDIVGLLQRLGVVEVEAMVVTRVEEDRSRPGTIARKLFTERRTLGISDIPKTENLEQFWVRPRGIDLRFVGDYTDLRRPGNLTIEARDSAVLIDVTNSWRVR